MKETPESPEEALFQQAAELPSPLERAAFLDKSCSGNPALHARLDELLECHFAGEGFFTQLPGKATAATRLGERYVLLEKIGEGGFGEVWMAEQLEPVKRRVAIKILKPGMDTQQVVARFQAERQALALMEHPCIAKVFDAGETEGRRPYFVMELVSGSKITEYCRENAVSMAERLQLFILVCRAIQHAHQKGIIHRDIKPSNILVTKQDGLPVPKVIDFGIAKAIQQGLTEKTVVTQFHQFLGTPAYISPEQALVTSEDIDTRSDIYSLGVLLYELLAGKPPFDNHELLTAGLDEMRRIIREKEPVRPSQCQPRSGVNPDLDWIVMKCLEKDRARRYETANGVAMDVQRFLDHEPIMARPPSSLYRVSKVVRRNPLVVSLVGLLLLAVASALVIVAVMNIRLAAAKKQTDRANQQLSKTVLFLESAKMEERAAEGLRAEPMAWLARRLRANPDDRAAAARLLAMLGQRSFGVPVFAPLRHDGMVHCVSFSPDGSEVMTASDDQTVRFWDARTGRALRVLTNSVSVARAAYLARGKRVLVNGGDGVARVYDGKTLLFQFPGLRNPSDVCLEGGKGRWLFVVHSTNTISRWDLETGRRLDPLITLPAPIEAVDYTDAGSALAVLCRDNTVHVRDEVTGKPLARVQKLETAISAIHFTPDGQRLFLALEATGRLAIWHYRATDELNEAAVPVPIAIAALLFSGDGRRLLAWRWNSPVHVLDPETLLPIGAPIDCGVNPGFRLSNSHHLAASIGQGGGSLLVDLDRSQVLLEPMQHEGTIYTAAFSADDTQLLTGSVDGTARLWDIRMRSAAGPALPKSNGGGAAAFNHAGNRFLVSVEANGVQVCSVDTSEPLGPVLSQPVTAKPDDGIREAWFSPDDRWILTVGVHGFLRIWNGSTYQPRLDIPTGYAHNVAKFSPDSRFIVTGDRDGAARVWDAETGKPLASVSHNGKEVVNVDFHPGGASFITAAADGMARCWSLPEGRLAIPPLRHRGIVWSASFSPNGERIVTASADKTAQIWDSRTGHPLHKALRHTKGVYFALFSPDGHRVATTSEDGTARVWNADTGEPVSPLLRHNAGIWQAAFTPDGSMLVTGSIDRTVRFWETETGLPMSEPLLHEGPLGRLSLSSDGRKLLTLGGQAHLWDVLQPPTPAPGWFCDFVEGMAGCRQAPDGQLLPTTPDAIDTVRKRVSSDSGRGSTPIDFYSRWAKWFLVDRMQEKVTGFRDH